MRPRKHLQKRDQEFDLLLNNFKKLKDEYEKQFHKMKEMEKEIEVLTSALKTNNLEDDLCSDTEENRNTAHNAEVTENMDVSEIKS